MTLPPGKYTAEEISWFRSIFDSYYESIRSFAYFKTGSVDLSDDIVQEVFLKVWSMRGTVRTETVKSLLYTIAGNIIKNHYKHLQVTYNFQRDNSAESPSESADSEVRMEELNQQLQQALASIPEGPREVFLMNRIEEMSYTEIADRLGLSVKAIEKRMSEALRVLREKFNYKI